MKQVTIHEAKTHLSRLIDEALNGEDVIIARRSEPLVRLSVIVQEPGRRKCGMVSGLILSMPDNFNDELEGWESPVFPDGQSLGDRDQTRAR